MLPIIPPEEGAQPANSTSTPIEQQEVTKEVIKSEEVESSNVKPNPELLEIVPKQEPREDPTNPTSSADEHDWLDYFFSFLKTDGKLVNGVASGIESREQLKALFEQFLKQSDSVQEIDDPETAPDSLREGIEALYKFIKKEESQETESFFEMKAELAAFLMKFEDPSTLTSVSKPAPVEVKNDSDDDDDLVLVGISENNSKTSMSIKDSGDSDDDLIVLDEPPIRKQTKRELSDDDKTQVLKKPKTEYTSTSSEEKFTDPFVIPSPMRLTTAHDLPESENVDTVSLWDLLNEPGLGLMWQFNFSVDIEYVMDQIMPTNRNNLWSWFIVGKRRDPMKFYNAERAKLPDADRISIEGAPLAAGNRFSNHHTKMMILGFTDKDATTTDEKPHEDAKLTTSSKSKTAKKAKVQSKNLKEIQRIQIVILTSNLTLLDWEKMTQGMWVSPFLTRGATTKETGREFQKDFSDYLSLYKLPILNWLTEELTEFNFDPVQVNLVMSAPGKFNIGQSPRMGLDALVSKLKFAVRRPYDGQEVKSWGNLGKDRWGGDMFKIQVSSLGWFGNDEEYFIESVLGTLNEYTLREACGGNISQGEKREFIEHVQLIWPTAQNVRNSIAGYASGVALFENSNGGVEFLKHRKRMQVWKSQRAGRDRMMPHIKTYTRVNKENDVIRWMVLTSANLSRAAWGKISIDGEEVDSRWGSEDSYGFGYRAQKFYNKGGSGRRGDDSIKGGNWELGVFFNRENFLTDRSPESEEQAVLVPVYRRDRLTDAEAQAFRMAKGLREDCKLVCMRMVYDLDTVAYEKKDRAWNGDESHQTRDWLGQAWPLRT